MFAKLLKIFATRCNIKTNIRSETPRLEGLHMSQDEHNKQKDITFIVELRICPAFPIADVINVHQTSTASV